MLFQPEDLLKLLLAVLAGGLIGSEREYRDKAAGFRTLIFICVGATLFTILSYSMATAGDPNRIAAGTVTGVGFLGAGVIMRDKGRVIGLTTAPTSKPNPGNTCIAPGQPAVLYKLTSRSCPGSSPMQKSRNSTFNLS